MTDSSRHAIEWGDFSFDLDGGDIRALRWRGADVLQRLHVAVRDDAWGTVPGVVGRMESSFGRDRARICFSSDHSAAGLPLVWTGTLELTATTLTATFDGTALEPMSVNRMGWCLLHPLTQVGSALECRMGDSTWSGTVPGLVSPQRVGSNGDLEPAWGPFSALVIETSDLRLDMQFEGDFFETEDQRNWTDASFKTYSTPLSLPRPQQFGRGSQIQQVVTIDLSPIGPTATLPEAPLPPARGGSRWSALMEQLVPDADLKAVREAVDTVRVRVHADDMNDAGITDPLIRRVSAAGPWELEVHAPRHADWEGLATLLSAVPAPECLIVLPADAISGTAEETTSVELLAEARRGLGPLPTVWGGGTPLNFCELQRNPLAHLDLISCTYSPTVHAADDRSIEETPQSYPAIAATAHAVAPQAAFSIGPLRDGVSGPESWLAESFSAWDRAGVDRICTLSVSDLAKDGRLTRAGAAVAHARESR